MSIVAILDIQPDEEVLVNYNYDVKSAPAWYKALWKDYVSGKTSRKFRRNL